MDNNSENNDLTVIKGIGKNRAQWLRDSLDIQTLRDLSIMPVDTIESRLKAEGFIASRAKIESWIEQARQILAEMAHDQTAKTQADRQSRKPKPCSADQVTQSVPTEIRFSIGSSVAKAKPAPDQEATQPEFFEFGGSNQINFVQVQAYQPVQTMRYAGISRAGQPFLGKLNSNEAFALEASFTLDEAISGGENAESEGFSARFFAYDTRTGAIAHLGNAGEESLKEVAGVKKILLPTAHLDKGLYRLRIYGILKGQASAKGYLEVPYVQVI